MEEFLKHAVPAFIGLLAGVVGSLIAPWVNWGIEKRKLRLNARRDVIAAARQMINRGSDKFEFRESTSYSRLRPFLSDRTKKEIESDKITVQLSGRGSGEHSGARHYARLTLDDLQNLEKQWGLL
jgi:hypothetical protein